MLANPDFVFPPHHNSTTTTTTNMLSDDSSELSSAPSDVEIDVQITKKDGILKFFSKAPKIPGEAKPATSPPRPKREPSPPHDYVLADNSDIAFIVMFRSRFTEAFQKSLPNFGPQELERDIVDTVPGEHAEHFICGLLGLLLNRKQDVKSGHYNRALEEAISSHKAQWPRDWEGKNPLSGGGTFTSMSPKERLTLLRTLIMWALASSDAVKAIIQASYKQNRHEDDLNQPLSVQPWGSDGDRRRYYLIEGLDDTHFRVYRESNHAGIKRTWWSVASNIDELKLLAQKLTKEDGGQKARVLSTKITAAIPRFEATEEKRKRREYRQARKQQFKNPEGNFSMYEGRTRGKRMKYTFSDEEDDIYSDATTSRRSTRNTGTHTPAEGIGGPTITQSGRQVRPRLGGEYGESIPTGGQPSAITAGFDSTSDRMSVDEDSGSRPRRAAAVNKTKPKGGRHIPGYNDVDEMSSDDEGDASEQDYGDDEEEEGNVSLADEDELTDDEGETEVSNEPGEKKSLVVKLPIKTPTPEKKTVIKLRLSPEKERTSRFPATDTTDPNGATGSLREASQSPAAGVSGSSEAAPVPPKSPVAASLALSPRSPLAFRSPEKPPPFQPAISVLGADL
ncbi:hypothetical protein BJ875DRAFT_458914 [Amylocarpus encephaloides]|uniref:WHIM1 domain-containing protein n=1 Tax=Amylocarpus encephaloides TaxID=45428 RepID=A0A9P8C695_9HELO|nr:hypothetical protein BJ875DRAFT_458914 [Amylocarpus encephaloides]